MAYFMYKQKKVFYSEYGNGNNPIVLLHGNTASSLMFSSIINYFVQDFKVIVIDFLGCGKSERIEKFDSDLWYDEAMQVIKLLEEKKIKKANIIGTSGGAIVAINVALEKPELVNKVIADSFEGEEALDIITNSIISDRENSKKDKNAKKFYQLMNGTDWEKVVDCDTKAIYEHSKTIKNFHHKDLSKLLVPILLTGSKEDEFASMINDKFYDDLFNRLLKKIKKGSVHIFEHGNHPAIMSNEEEFSKLAKKFILE